MCQVAPYYTTEKIEGVCDPQKSSVPYVEGIFFSQIISMQIGDNRIDGMETGSAIIRAVSMHPFSMIVI